MAVVQLVAAQPPDDSVYRQGQYAVVRQHGNTEFKQIGCPVDELAGNKQDGAGQNQAALRRAQDDELRQYPLVLVDAAAYVAAGKGDDEIRQQVDAQEIADYHILADAAYQSRSDADALAVNLTQKHMRGRMAESLLMLKDKYGYEDDGITLRCYLSREELANMSNMTTGNAIRMLSALSAESIIITDGRKIKITDEKRLLSISENGR